MLGGRSALLGAAGSGNPYGNWTGNYSDVSLLLRNDTPTTVLIPLDESPSPKALTTAGNAGFSTLIKKYGTSSMVFDGSGDYFRSPLNAGFDFGTGDFTIECWVNFNTLATDQMFMAYMAGADTSTSFALGRLGTGVFRFFIYSGGTLYISTITPSPAVEAGTWYHVAGVRSGGQMRIYVNGVGGTAVTANVSPSTVAGRVLDVGAWAGVQFFNGYIDDLRITKGVARYTANFTPSTAELPANITDDPSYNSVSLLLRNGTPTTVLIPLDESPSPKEVTALGNAAISTLIKKYGTSSMVFDGIGGMSAEYDSSLDLAGGNFTIEAWVRFGALLGTSSGRTLVSRYTTTARSYLFWVFRAAAGGYFLFFDWTTNNSTRRFASAGISTPNTTDFYHYAVVRSGEQILLFENGQQLSLSTTPSTPLGTFFNQPTPLEVGTANAVLTGSLAFNGYIDDLRITKGFARYTKNFLPPPAELPAI